MTGLSRIGSRAAATAVGLVASRFLPPIPDEVHPVAQFGHAMSRIESVVYADDRRAGAVYAGAGTVVGASAASASGSTAVSVAVCAAGAQLRQVAAGIADLLDEEDLDKARAALPSLVGRDPSGLDHAGIAAAVIESVAENMVDAVFAPAMWGVLAGPIGAGAHRALNTMDAMVGRRDDRYGNFGWAAARADDAAAFVPARLFAAALAVVAPGRLREIRRAVVEDAPAHPSPNAGVAEAAMAAALGVELGGTLRYGDTVEDRPRLGTGMRPGVADVHRAIVLARRCEDLAIASLAAGAALSWWRHR